MYRQPGERTTYTDTQWGNHAPLGQNEQEMVDAGTHAYQDLKEYVKQEEPKHSWKQVMKHQLNPNLVGALTTIGFAVLMTFDCIQNGPSDLVTNYPLAAAAALGGAAITVGALFRKLVSSGNAQEIKQVRQAEREQAKAKERSHQ